MGRSFKKSKGGPSNRILSCGISDFLLDLFIVQSELGYAYPLVTILAYQSVNAMGVGTVEVESSHGKHPHSTDIAD